MAMKRLKAPAGGCTVRMYRHGLGDCFLLAFAAKNNHQKYILIDCGVLVGTTDADEKIKKVAQDIKDATGGNLNAVVITHEHWDHVSGFAQAESVFKEIGANELWMAWTEDPENLLARQLKERQRRAFAGLHEVQERFGNHDSNYSERITRLMDFFGPGLGTSERITTEGAMEKAKEMWKGHIYCSPGEPPLTISGLPDVSFYVLGPPQDKRFIKKSRPSKKDSEVYLDDPSTGDLGSLLNALSVSSSRNVDTSNKEDNEGPFNPAYYLDVTHKDAVDIYSHYTREDWRKIDNNWNELAGELALRLDAHTNNTSLVLAIELSPGGKVLLFPGDAQVGNWLSWNDIDWQEDDSDLTSSDLLERTVLYKVGHHGSHNATLSKHGLEKMINPDLKAVIPVDQETARKRHWHMPHVPLHERLVERTSGRVILSDEGIEKLKNSGQHANFLEDVYETKLYVDITIKK